jgi:membrane-associated phospholipid phosphatase
MTGVLVLLCAAISHAADSSGSLLSRSGTEETRDGEKPQLRYNLPVDVGVTLGAGSLALTLELFSSKINPKTCRWCDRDSNGKDTLNAFDAWVRNSLRWSNTTAANRASGVFSYGLAPVAGLGLGALLSWHENRLHNFPVDVLIVSEAAMLSINLDQITKIAAGRERPFVHFRSASERDATHSNGDDLSFYSGHTSFAFALATSAGTVASMRRYRWAPVMWVTGMALAATSGYLRIAADRHYATDVLAGAVVGSAIGFGVPYFAHGPSKSVQLAPMNIQGASGLLLWGYW